jgi:threonine synthase
VRSLLRDALPARLADLFDRPERLTRLPAELDPVEAFVRAHIRRNAA